jgi:hypothetical protein
MYGLVYRGHILVFLLESKDMKHSTRLALLSCATLVCARLAFASEPTLEVDDSGTLVATNGTSRITITDEGLVDANGLKARCGAGIQTASNAAGAKINCASLAINVHDEFGNQLRIAGTVAKFNTAEGKVLSKLGWIIDEDSESAPSQPERQAPKAAPKDEDESIRIDSDGIKIDGEDSISITEDGIVIR